MEMKKNRFQLILILSGCGCILLAAFLAAFAFHRPATVVQEPEDVPSDPVLIEQENIDIINMETVSATPDPSILSSLPPFAVTLISTFAEKTSVLEFSVCAQTGVIRMISATGSATGPPADRLYPVEPVGVEIITPSAE